MMSGQTSERPAGLEQLFLVRGWPMCCRTLASLALTRYSMQYEATWELFLNTATECPVDTSAWAISRQFSRSDKNIQ